MVHMGAVVSIGAGAVSFTHIVKAAEPVFTALFSACFLGQIFSVWTYLTLIPVVFGVGIASATELTFTWVSFGFAMVSNLGSSGRAIFAKRVMNEPKEVGVNLTPSNMYSLLTIVASLVAVPLALMFEGSAVAPVWAESTTSVSPQKILFTIFLSGIWYYSYNEFAFHALESVDQVTHAVGNTLKRVVIIVATVVVFQNPVTLLGAAGSAVAVAGTLLYSMVKQHCG